MESMKSEIVRRVERDALEAREEVNRLVESTLRQIPPQIRGLEARKAIQLPLGKGPKRRIQGDNERSDRPISAPSRHLALDPRLSTDFLVAAMQPLQDWGASQEATERC